MDGNYNSNYIFNYADPAPDFTNNAGIEHPSHQITVKIRLNPSNITSGSRAQISSKLKAQNMSLSSSSGNVITVSGIPPNNGFDRNSVLTIVQQHNKGAQFAN